MDEGNQGVGDQSRLTPDQDKTYERPSANILNMIAPSGKLRIGVVAAPVRSAFFVVMDANGVPSGVTIDLGREFARKLGVPADFVVALNGGALVDAVSSGSVDVAFMPVDHERRKRLDFGPCYIIIESTYLVRPDSDIMSIADVDRPCTRVVGLADTATIRAAARSLNNAVIAAANSVDEAIAMLTSGKADAIALTRDALVVLAAGVPGARILEGSFLQTGIAIAVPKNRPDVLLCATEFMENAKASGLVQRALDNAGLLGPAVIPPVQQP